MDRVPTATQPSEELLLRAVQLYELLPIRTGVMLLGPAAGGKTTVRQVLQLALSKDGQALQCTHIYPKVGCRHGHSSWELCWGTCARNCSGVTCHASGVQ